MAALEVWEESPDGMANERPTLPVPYDTRESSVRLRVARVAYGSATVDVVLCDLSRDPRSESYAESRAGSLEQRATPSTMRCPPPWRT